MTFYTTLYETKHSQQCGNKISFQLTRKSRRQGQDTLLKTGQHILETINHHTVIKGSPAADVV